MTDGLVFSLYTIEYSWWTIEKNLHEYYMQLPLLFLQK